jgi:uncharacterized protein YndB with AHSA1/START domain
MEDTKIAKASILIQASLASVWEALVNPEIIKGYMFGTTVVSDWKEGSPIYWRSKWQGKSYEDKGTILQFKRLSTLQYSHYSPLTGAADVPENYHTVTIYLSELPTGVEVTLTQDNNPTKEAQEHSEKNWKAMLDGLKKYLEKK